MTKLSPMSAMEIADLRTVSRSARDYRHISVRFASTRYVPDSMTISTANEVGYCELGY